MKKKAVEFTEAQQLQWFNRYLAAGQGRGRLISAATVYEGKVGYFCVHPIEVEGVKQECILFACMPHEDVLITAFPLHPNACQMSVADARTLYEEARSMYQ